MTPAISVENVSYRYGDKTALEGVSLELATGKSLALVGPNGGGKSTLFRLLTTLTHPHSGTVRLFGVPTTDRSARARVGVVFQNPALDGKLTVEENLQCQAAIYGMSRAETKSRMAKWLGLVGLTGRSSDCVDKLSGGLKRRLEIARACLVEPSLLLMDEPTSSLDPKARKEVWALLTELRKTNGVTLLFSTHLIEEAQAADSVVFIAEGRVILSGTPEALRASLGGDILTINAEPHEPLLNYLKGSLGLSALWVDGEIRVETSAADELISKVLKSHRSEIRNLTLGKPTLADLFFQKTGRIYSEAAV